MPSRHCKHSPHLIRKRRHISLHLINRRNASAVGGDLEVDQKRLLSLVLVTAVGLISCCFCSHTAR
eukprot:scaffold322450_cov14-Tisochrysis_lutea.AAC.1